MQMEERVHNHQLSDSPSKQQFSFPKAPRFREYRPPLTQVQYTLPSTFSKKGYSFGNAPRRSQIGPSSKHEGEKSPAPGDYSPSGAEDKTSGWSFGASKKPEIPGTKTTAKQLLWQPGPGAYNVLPDDFGKFATKYSMRPKVSPSPQRSQTPGPGSYRPKIDLNAMGYYFPSNVPSSKAPRFSPCSDIPTRKPREAKTPGPGAYNPRDNLAKDGAYFLSHMRSSQCRTFGKDSRSHSVKRLDTPGPGSYRLQSDFGCYDPPSPVEMPLSTRRELSRGKLV